jgi:uncharacterized protein (TIGR00299 family) protein
LKIAYLDCFSGISGDMCLGGLVDAGISPRKLLRELKKLPVKGYRIRIGKVKRAGISATKADVIIEKKSKMLGVEGEETYNKERRAKNDPTHPPLSKGRSKEGFKGHKEGFKTRNKEGLIIKKLKTEGEEQGAKKWEDIENIIRKSSLSKGIKEKGLRVFRRLFDAEAKVHGERFERVHLHELSAVDCLIDIFGTIIGFDILGAEKIYSSPVNLGSGFIKSAHGVLPVPAPAAAEILKGAPVYSTDSNFELTTPTGAALVMELSSEFGDIPLMNIETIGLGAGNRNFKDRPNVLRLFVGNPAKSPYAPLFTPLYPPLVMGELKGATEAKGIAGNSHISPLANSYSHISPLSNHISPLSKSYSPSPLWQRGVRGDSKEGPINPADEIATVIEANIDDMNPQIYEYLMELLFEKGALDVFLTQLIMKKGRPGTKLTVLCKETEREEITKIILTETTTIGLRFYNVQRRVLQREIKLVNSEFGKVKVKFSRLGNEILKATPEYEDCKKLARKLNIPLIDIMRRIKIPTSK